MMSNDEIQKMSNDEIQKQKNFLIGKAFLQLLQSPPAELAEKLDSQRRKSLATYLTKLPPADRENPSAMVEHIGKFCYAEENEYLKKWLLTTYNSLSEDSGQKIFTTRDPKREAMALKINQEILDNESRDVCQKIQEWAAKEIAENSQGNQNDSQSN
jgi:hypothetical protein